MAKYLFCAIVGVKGSAFRVDIDADMLVGELKDAIKEKGPVTITTDASNLQLFLGKTADGAWVSSVADDVKKLENGVKTPRIYELAQEDKELQEEYLISEYLEGMDVPKAKQIHVLVKLPTKQLVIEINDFQDDEEVLLELKHYQQRGLLIQNRCQDYCAPLLTKIDELYEKNDIPAPFICVEGSSGMGKTQLAFALGGKRPWYYWSKRVNTDSQLIYRSFSSLSKAFTSVVHRDSFSDIFDTKVIFNTISEIYRKEELWTYGFICALLEHSRSEEHQSARQMIRFDSATRFNVKPCKWETVRAVIAKMKEEEKMLSFFILDEISFRAVGMYTEAFQRNVFRACGLVVIIIGRDTNITNLIAQVKVSDGEPSKWMTLVPRFPSHQMMLNTSEEKQTWTNLVRKYPTLNDIVTHSRGRFARLFMKRVVQYVIQSNENEIELMNLFDEGFAYVSERTPAFLDSREGKRAQLFAISYRNVLVSSDEPPQKKRRSEAGYHGMHVHFTNLIDDQLTDIFACKDQLWTKGGSRWKLNCCFPTIDEDVLLYLTILGGKAFPSYYNRQVNVHSSTKWIFAETRMGPLHDNTISNAYYENMVAHAIFSSSRRNGVQGIMFSDFFPCLLGEFQDERWNEMELHCRITHNAMTANDLFEGYEQNVINVLVTTIPFLAPPNAEWPPFIIDNNRYGCSFGHLV